MAWDNDSKGLGKHWPEIRRRVLRRDPVCMICRREKSTTVDHIRNRASTDRDWTKVRVTDHVSLCQGLCRGCHNEKTQREAAAGRARVRSQRARPADRHPGMASG